MKENNEKMQKNTKKPPYSIIAAVFGAIMAAGIALVALNLKAMSGITAPVAVGLVLTVVGAVGMSTAVTHSIMLLMKYDKELEKARESFKVDPEVLRDPRIRELPKIKKLMKNENVKRIFEAEKISAADLSDPHVQLFIDALLELADENGVIRFE